MRLPNRLFPQLALAATFAVLICPGRAGAQAADPAEGRYKVASGFAGVDFEIYAMKRIQQNRLMVVVRIRATQAAPPAGVLIGYAAPTPAVVLPKDDYKYLPKLFALSGSIMTDEVTETHYPMLDPIRPPGVAMLGGATRSMLRPKQAVLLSIQFMAPPPPPPQPGQPPVIQKLSFLLPKTAGPIQHVPIPLPADNKVDYLNQQPRSDHP